MRDERASVEARYRALLAEALASEPAALELSVFGEDALEAALRRGEVDYSAMLGAAVAAISAGVLMLAQEIDALHHAIAARQDEPDAR